MARKQASKESILDMFTRFGQDLKMPRVDVEAILELHRKNLEALEQAAKVSATGASSVMKKQREMLEETLAAITEMSRELRTPGTPQEAMTKQAEFARKSFEAALRNAGEVAELVRKSSTNSIDILGQRIRDAMEEIRQGYERNK